MSKRKSQFDSSVKKEFEKFWNQMKESNPRSVAIVGAAYLEHLVEKLLSSFMVNEDETKQLLEVNGPIGAFETKAKTAYCLGLITLRMYKNLKLISHIRNAFAHQIDLSTFNDEWVADKCKALQLPDIRDSKGALLPALSTRDIYEFAIRDTAISILVEILDSEDPERRKVLEDAAPFYNPLENDESR